MSPLIKLLQTLIPYFVYVINGQPHCTYPMYSIDRYYYNLLAPKNKQILGECAI